MILYHGNLVNTGNLTIRAAAEQPDVGIGGRLLEQGHAHRRQRRVHRRQRLRTDGRQHNGRARSLTEGGSSSVVRIKGGRLSGTGLIAGAVNVSGGQVTPGGTNIGTLSIAGLYAGLARSSGVRPRRIVRRPARGARPDEPRGHGARAQRIPTDRASSRTLVSSARNSLTAHLTCVTTSGTWSDGHGRAALDGERVGSSPRRELRQGQAHGLLIASVDHAASYHRRWRNNSPSQEDRED